MKIKIDFWSKPIHFLELDCTQNATNISKTSFRSFFFVRAPFFFRTSLASSGPKSINIQVSKNVAYSDLIKWRPKFLASESCLYRNSGSDGFSWLFFLKLRSITTNYTLTYCFTTWLVKLQVYYYRAQLAFPVSNIDFYILWFFKQAYKHVFRLRIWRIYSQPVYPRQTHNKKIPLKHKRLPNSRLN